MNISAVSSNLQVQAYNPYASGPVVSDDSNGGGFTGFSTDFTSISSMVSHAGGGGFAAYKLSGNMAESIKTIFGKGTPPATSGFGQNLMTGMKGIAINGAKGAGLSALVSAGVSAVANGVGVATGKIDSSEAVGNVVKDTIGGAVGGLVGVTAAGVGHIFLGRFGTIGTIAAVALGAVGGVAGGKLAGKLTENF